MLVYQRVFDDEHMQKKENVLFGGFSLKPRP